MRVQTIYPSGLAHSEPDKEMFWRRSQQVPREYSQSYVEWCPKTDSNRRPTIYETVALPAELLGLSGAPDNKVCRE
jgi:hypothetical protein